MQKVTTFLWFDNNAEEAMNLYVSLFKNSKILEIHRYPNAGPDHPGEVMTASFQLDGQEFMALNGGPEFHFTEAISLFVNCEDQAEVDRLWNALTTDGGAESQCGWLKDKFGLSWQIIPKQLTQLLGDPDPVKANRVMQAMLQMQKINVQKLQEAHDQP